MKDEDRYNKKLNYKENLREYFRIIGNYKKPLFWMVLLTIITELLFVLDKFLYKRIIDDGQEFVVGNLLIADFTKILLIIALIFLGLVLIRAFSKWISVRLLVKLEPRIAYDIKKKYFNHIIKLHYGFHTTHKTGSLISRMTRGIGAVGRLTDVFIFQIAPLIIQIILVSIAIASFSIESVIVVLIVSLLFISYSVIIQKKQNPHRDKWNKTRDKENAFIGDVFTNVESVKYFGKEKQVSKRFDQSISNTRRNLEKFLLYFARMDFGQYLILGLGTLALIYFPMVKFLAGEVTLGTIALIYSLWGNIAGNLFSFVWGIRNFYESIIDFQDLFEYDKIKNEIKDKKNAKELRIGQGEVFFEDITFNYKGRKMFNKFNLRIRPNEKIALVGHSGSGKSTLVKLFNRLYDVESGSIKIDGVDIREYKQESLRSESGIVPQECILFDDTIFNNIKFAKPNATRAEVLKAMKFAQLDKFVKRLPDKENTIVGERGVKLSGGEKQRVSIARAILANKKILVLDEATSALDSETEHEIQKDLLKLLEGRTSIVIAHRLSTIMSADRIIVLKEGKIVEEGRHDQLIRKKGEYFKLWNLQKGGYLED